MDNTGYSSDQGSNVTEYTDVVERRQMADPLRRAQRLSADQPSLAGEQWSSGQVVKAIGWSMCSADEMECFMYVHDVDDNSKDNDVPAMPHRHC